MKNLIYCLCIVLAMALTSCGSQQEKAGDIKSTDSGVMVVVVEPGSGEAPSVNSTVKMRYTASLPDGTVFDSVDSESGPVAFMVSQMIPGMAEALCLMHPGGTYTVSIPAHMAYGEQGIPGVIPPSSPLNFKVEIVDVINEN